MRPELAALADDIGVPRRGCGAGWGRTARGRRMRPSFSANAHLQPLDKQRFTPSLRASFLKTDMANTLSAAKRARQSVRRTSRNRKTRVSVKSELKGIRAAIAAGKKDEAGKLLSQVSRVLDKA